MMKKILCVMLVWCVMLVSVASISANSVISSGATGDGSDLFVFFKNDTAGFMDVYGNIVIDNRFWDARDFSDGLAAVEFDRGGARKFIDINGNIVAAFYEFTYIQSFQEGLAFAVCEWGRGFFIDIEGNDVFGKTFIDTLGGFSNGFAAVQIAGELNSATGQVWTYIDRTGNFATDSRFDSVGNFSNGFARVRTDGRTAIINTDFEFVISFDNEYSSLSGISSCGHLIAMKDGLSGLINLNNEVVIDFKYAMLRLPSNGLLLAQKERFGYFGLIDMYNNIISPFDIESVRAFSQGVILIRETFDHYIFIDRYGNRLLEIAPTAFQVRRGDRYEYSAAYPIIRFFEEDRGLIVVSMFLLNGRMMDSFSINRNFEIIRPRWQSPPERIAVMTDGRRIPFDVEPFIYNGRTMVPMRMIFEWFGTEVNWCGDTRTVIGRCWIGRFHEMKITIDSNVAQVNGEAVELDVPAMLHNARTMVPLRFIAETLGAEVDWCGDTRTVIINTN